MVCHHLDLKVSTTYLVFFTLNKCKFRVGNSYNCSQTGRRGDKRSKINVIYIHSRTDKNDNVLYSSKSCLEKCIHKVIEENKSEGQDL